MTNVPRPPTPEQQLAFLTNLERLLSEGSFVATYKYALLIALTEIAVERADDSGAEFEIAMRGSHRRCDRRRPHPEHGRAGRDAQCRVRSSSASR